jgi:glutathione S-transferase
MKLFTYATSPYARKAQMALEFKGVAFEPIERCYSLDRKEDLRAASERAEVPVLVLDDGRTISDSTIICEYLEDAYPTPPLFPKDPFARAEMRTFEDLCDRGFDAVSYGYWMSQLRKDSAESGAMALAARDEFSQLLARLESALGDRQFFFDDVSLADIAAICYVPSAPAMKIAMDRYPRLGAWMNRMRAIPAVAADNQRIKHALANMHDIASELEGPDGKIHWRDTRLEWPVRRGFIDLVVREFRADKMMFPPDAC